MKSSLTLPAAVLGLVLATSMAPAPAHAHTTAVAPTESGTTANLTEEQTRTLVERLKSGLPEDYQARIAALDATVGLPPTRPGQTNAGATGVGPSRPVPAGGRGASPEPRLTDRDDEVCQTTPLLQWQTAAYAEWTEYDLAEVVPWIDFFRMYDAVLFGTEAGHQYYGSDGQFTTRVRQTARELKRFWDIPSGEIQVVPMHATVALDQAKVARLMELLMLYPADQAAQFAADFVPLVNQEKFDYGMHPALSFDAFAYYGGEVAGVGVIPPKILVGDGILEAYGNLGLGNIAPRAIVAHEYAHHVQYVRGLFASELTGAELARRAEMMADAYAGYFLAHVRGAGLDRGQTKQVNQTFFQLGDCYLTSPGHHGTPNQRMRAADWGAQVAKGGFPRGRILPTVTIAQRFDAHLSELVAANPA
ncbi:hypothetical protein ACIBF5_01155 [Micromonospora sp. NPDC050417]|uniref:hypothetical protein n=1 Tax=Micromonospora sp. NPDC050417 TaxID=3364280 RepID=UPI0037AE9B92